MSLSDTRLSDLTTIDELVALTGYKASRIRARISRAAQMGDIEVIRKGKALLIPREKGIEIAQRPGGWHYRSKPAGPYPCQVEDCHQSVQAKGYCWKHYARLHRYGRLTRERKETPEPSIPQTCQAPLCTRVATVKGYCYSHYQTANNHNGSLAEVQLRPERLHNHTCSVKDCNQTHYAKNLCRPHYDKKRYIIRNRNDQRQVQQTR